MIMRFLIFILLFMPYMAFANIPSISYVQQHVAAQIANAVANKADIQTVAQISTELANKASIRSIDDIELKIGVLPTGYNSVGTALKAMVDTSTSANQTMAGSYTVSGTFNVPTPTLPTAE